MSRKLALLIGNDTYEDSAFSRLAVPTHDIRALAEVLSDPEIAGFDQVTPVENQTAGELKITMEKFLQNAAADDLLVVYFSGHGLRNQNDGRLYLAVKDTRQQTLRSTGISSAFVTEVLDDCLCRRQILILDCCYSGAFVAGAKGVAGESIDTRGAFGSQGFGRIILSASDETQYAWEGENVVGQAPKTSLYTRFLIQGLKTGAADRDRDGQISIHELHDYAYDEVRRISTKQSPRLHALKAEGQIVIGSVPESLRHAVELPRHIVEALAIEGAGPRLSVIPELERMLRGAHSGLSLAARKALGALVDDDSRSVSAAAAAALGESARSVAVPAGAPRNVSIPATPQERADDVMLRGAQRLGAAIRATFGPLARNVVVNRKDSEPLVTTDACAIARESEFKNPLESLGARAIRNAVINTSHAANDGGALSGILAHGILEEGLKISPGGLRLAFTRGVRAASALVIEQLKQHSFALAPEPVVNRFATLTIRDDFWGWAVADAFNRVGKDGPIVIDASASPQMDVQVVRGMRTDGGYFPPILMSREDELILDNPRILLFEKAITGPLGDDLQSLIRRATPGGQPLVVITSELAVEFGVWNGCAVKAPGFGDRRKNILDDIAILTDGQAILGEGPITLAQVPLSALGTAQRVIVTRDSTTIIQGAGSQSDVDRRIQEIRQQIAETSSEYDREKFQERLAALTTGVAVIHLGGDRDKKPAVIRALSSDPRSTKASSPAAALGSFAPQLR